MHEQNPKIQLIQKLINARLTKEEMQSVIGKAEEIISCRKPNRKLK